MSRPDEALELKSSSPGPPPLVLDLDGTLIKTDLFAETLLLFFKASPFRFPTVFLWLWRGRAYLKQRLAQAVTLDVSILPARAEVVAYAEAAAMTRKVYLATAADRGLAEQFRARFSFITEVIGSDGATNLKGVKKAEVLAARFPDGFDYVGDASADWPVWRAARVAIYAGRSRALAQRLGAEKQAVEILPLPKAGLRVWAKALRVHQWSKNLLILVPLVLGGKATDPKAWASGLLGFFAMGLLASATYLLNDLLDLQDDRQHWSKRNRALTSGQISLWVGILLVPVGLLAGMALGWLAQGWVGVAGLASYLILTLLYSFRFKREPILDVVTLGGLFTLRLVVGVLCAQVAWSAWLLVFSMFLFTSLSFAKRFTEIERLAAKDGVKSAGRGYVPRDQPLVLALGVSLASAAVLVMVMYLIEEAFRANFYRAPQFLWVFPITLALWLGRVWLLCGRGELHDDPVVFAVRDRISLGLGFILGASLIAALIL